MAKFPDLYNLRSSVCTMLTEISCQTKQQFYTCTSLSFVFCNYSCYTYFFAFTLPFELTVSISELAVLHGTEPLAFLRVNLYVPPTQKYIFFVLRDGFSVSANVQLEIKSSKIERNVINTNLLYFILNHLNLLHI